MPGPQRSLQMNEAHRERLRARAAQKRSVRRARGLAGLVVLGLVILIIVITSGSSDATRQTAARRHVRVPIPIPAAESGLLPWQLPTPLSREVVAAGSAGRLVILGGLKGSTSERSVFSLNSADGDLQSIGSLAFGVHDAAGSVIAGRDVVVGGGSPATVAGVEAFGPVPTPGRLGPFPSARSGVIAQLPQPRSDLAAATIGTSTYIVGGYDGARPDPQVLVTSDGRTFRRVASLPVPVRYPAVAALSGKLYVFGGERISGTGAGSPTDDIQVIDPGSGSASVTGHLPEPLEAAAAMTLGGNIYLAGGDSSTAQSSAPGIGTTQLSPPVHPRGPSGLHTVSTIWALNRARRGVLARGGSTSGSGLARRQRRAGQSGLAGGRRNGRDSGGHRPDDHAQPGVWPGGRSGGGLTVLRRAPADCRPGQQPPAATQHEHADRVEVPVRVDSA